MPTLAWPDLTIKPRRADWSLVCATQVDESPLTGASQTQGLPGAYWTCVLDYGQAMGANARLLRALTGKLRGRAGRVLVPAYGYDRPAGAGGGSPVVAGGGQSGTSLAVAGAPASVTGWLLEGDLFGLDGYLYMCTANANTAGGGTATLSVFPELRRAPPDAAALTLVRPSTTMMLAADEQGTTYTPGPVTPYVLTFREWF